jgi:phage shock protein E
MEKVNTISIDELREAINSGEKQTIVDVRTAREYEEKHIPGAIHIPVNAIERRAFRDLPKDERIIVYGDSEHSADAIDAAKTLDRLGYVNAVAEGGCRAWQDRQWAFS